MRTKCNRDGLELVRSEWAAVRRYMDRKACDAIELAMEGFMKLGLVELTQSCFASLRGEYEGWNKRKFRRLRARGDDLFRERGPVERWEALFQWEAARARDLGLGAQENRRFFAFRAFTVNWPLSSLNQLSSQSFR